LYNLAIVSPLAPLIAIALAVASAPSPSLGEQLGAGAGQAVLRVGYLCEYGSGWQGYLPFVERLKELGYRTDGAATGTRGAPLEIVFRGCAMTEGYLRELARQLVVARVDVIVAPGAVAARAAREATRALPIPVVFVGVDDPVAAGFVASLGRPGGNITGIAGTAPEASSRRLALLKEAAPDVTRVAVLVNPRGAAAPALLRETTVAAQALGLRLDLVELRETAGDGLGQAFDSAFSAIGETGADALLVLPDPLFLAYRGWILAYAWKARLPGIYREEVHVVAEAPPGLLSYGPSVVDQYVVLAGYVDKVLRGLDPAALPVARPTTFELAINLRAAARFGLSLPKPLLDRATKVVE
jgi:putative ABC transport system substrate-binding protein